MAITIHPDHKDLLQSYEKDGERYYILQVRILAEQFLKSLGFLRNKIDTARKTDPQFIVG